MDVVLLTPPAPGAIAVYLLAGADCRSMLRPCCGDKVLALKPGDVKRINLHDGEYVIDDALIVCTAEDICELHLHGGVALVREVAGLFRRMGANVVDPQSDAGRALAAGACGVDAYRRGIGADILAALPAARTATAVDLLAHQLEHGLAKWRTSALANLGAGSLPLWQFQSDVQWLLERSHALRFLLQPPRIAIVGPPNAGKSTLANALLGRPVSITSDIPGTTRDWVDADGVLVHTLIEIPAIFLDTAGIRATSDAIELESIRRSHDQLRQADAAIVVLDAAAPADAATLELLQAIAGDPNMPPAVIAENKCDCPVLALEVPASVGFPRRRISALTQQGIPELLKAVMELLGIADVDAKEPFAFARRQRDILRRAAVADTVEAALEILAGL